VKAAEALFRDIDARWTASDEGVITLRIIGSTALMLQADYERGTKDADVIETAALSAESRTRLLALAGEGTPLAGRHRMYVQVVGSAVPFLPQVPRYHTQSELNATLRHFAVEVLDVVDVIVSKIKRLNRDDLADIEAMVDLDRVPHDALIDRFRAAVEWFLMDARAEDLPKYVAKLHRVERDILAVGETEIELPEWI
jgi:hypothetical protein